MSFKSAKDGLSNDLEEIKANGLWKTERYINSEQKSAITLSDGSEVINMCANNYLGLANNPQIIDAAKKVITRLRTKRDGQGNLRMDTNSLPTFDVVEPDNTYTGTDQFGVVCLYAEEGSIVPNEFNFL